MSFFELWTKNTARLTKAELIKLVLRYFAACQCEADSITIHGEGNGYTVTITRSVAKHKA